MDNKKIMEIQRLTGASLMDVKKQCGVLLESGQLHESLGEADILKVVKAWCIQTRSSQPTLVMRESGKR